MIRILSFGVESVEALVLAAKRHFEAILVR